MNFFPNFSPPRTGGEQRSFYLLKALSKTFDIVSVSPSYEEGRLEIIEISPGFVEVRVPKTPAYRSVSASIRKQKSPIHQTAMAYALASPGHSEMVDYICGIWDSVDGVILQHASCAGLLDALNLPAKKTFYVSHNCEFELAVNAHRETHEHTYSMVMHQFEYRTCQHASVVVACTDQDADKFRHLYGVGTNSVHVSGNGSVDRFGDGHLANSPAPNHGSALFLGSKWGPNRKAAEHILSKLAPENPDLLFHIVGNVCEVLPVDEVPANVRLHGELSEEALAALMRETHIGLNPIIDGAGSNVKLADYLAHGLRVITTEKGARGFVHELENLTIVPTEGLSLALQEALAQPPVTGQIRERWRSAASFLWSWDTIGEELAGRLTAEFAGTVPLKRDKRILVMNEFPVRGRDSGGEARIAGLLSNPDPDMLVTIVTFGRGDFDLHQLHPQVACIELPAIREQKDAVAQMNRYAYTSADDVVFPATSSRNGNFLAAMETMVGHADSIVLEHPFMWPIYKQLRSRAPVVFGSHNVEADMKLVTLDSHKRKYELCDQIRDWEMELTQHAELVCACSPGDADVYTSWGAKAVHVLENGVTPLEDQLGEIDLSEERSIYLRREFDLGPDQAGAVVEALLKREGTPEEVDYVARVLSEGGTAVDSMLASIIRSPENLNGPKTYVTGLDRNVEGARFSTVFLGTSHRPNLSAAELIVGHFAPQCPEIDFVIMGKVGRSLAARDLPDNVFLTGFVSNEVKTAAMRDIHVGLNPMTEGGGSNLKIPDYLVHDLDVVSTPFGARGFEVNESGGLFQAEILDFVPVLKRLASENEAGQAARDRSAVSRYYWSELSKKYFELISQHTRLRTSRPIVLAESTEYIHENSFTPEATYLPQHIHETDAEVLVRAPALTYGTLEPAHQPMTYARLRYIEEPRELQLSV
ncbi:MAG: glycosyltransferase, partial [Pseudomonadota bacterium]